MKHLLIIRHLLLVMLLSGSALLQTRAQTIDKNIFFGINYWLYNQNPDGSVNESFNRFEKDLASAKLGLYRIGGIYPNESKKTLNDRDWYVNAITKIKAIGGEPLVQLPIDLTQTEVVSWYNYFNVTKGLNIKYFAIGNEPDPVDFAANGTNWFNGSYYQHNRNYTGFRGQFRSIATKLKEIAPNSVIVGPSFALFFGDLQATANNPMNTYYEDFIGDIGNDLVNGKPILDIFAFNFYEYKTESEMDGRFADLKQLIDNVNAQRPTANKLVFGVTETNCKKDAAAVVRPWDFKAGQFVSLMLKKTMAYGGAFVTPWSIFESGGSAVVGDPDFSFYNNDNTRRSTMHHYNLLSSHVRGNYMPSEQDFEANNVIALGMKDADGYTVMLMNTTNATSYTYRATLNNAFSGSTAQVKIKFTGGTVAAEMSGTIAPKSTVVYTLSAAGDKLSKFTYADGDAAPTEIILTDPIAAKYFHTRNVLSAHYLRPVDGLATQKIVQDASTSVPTLSSFEWQFIPAGNGYYYIKNKGTTNLIRPLNAATTENAEMQQITDDATNRALTSTKWKMEPAGGGKYWIRNLNSGLYLRPAANTDDSPIVQVILNRTYTAPQWTLVYRSVASSARYSNPEILAETGATLLTYPNPLPINGQLTLNYPITEEKSIIKIYDVTGKLIHTEESNSSGHSTIRLNRKFKPGLYRVELGSQVSKILVH